METAEEFWSRVWKGDGERCWLWEGAESSGYGHLVWKGRRKQGAHRVAWELARGPVPDGLWVLHSCDNPLCVRPDHLFLGTNADNIADAFAKGRMPLGSEHHSAKLDPEKVRAIRARIAAGEALAAIARDFGVSDQALFKLRDGKTWKHIDQGEHRNGCG